MKNKIQLYSFASSNGKKIGIALEEMELSYEAHIINIRKGEQFSEEFTKISPNSKIPAIVDPDGPDGGSISIMESGAILIYLADKSGRFLSTNATLRNETLQWLFFQVGHIGPMFAQFGHFYRNQDKCDHSYPRERYATETRRLLGVLEKRFEENEYLVGNEYSIADIATFTWVWSLSNTYDAREYLKLDEFKNVNVWLEKCLSRPAAIRGAQVCAVPK